MKIPLKSPYILRKNPLLYAHTVSNNILSLSLSDKPQASKVVLGTIPSSELTKYAQIVNAPFGSDSNDPVIPHPDTFKANRDFLPLVYKVLHGHAHECPTLAAQAVAEYLHSNMYMAICDARQFPMPGKTPQVEDVLGYVRLDSPKNTKHQGNIIPQSFEPNQFYRLVSTEGIFTPPSEYLNKLILDM